MPNGRDRAAVAVPFGLFRVRSCNHVRRGWRYVAHRALTPVGHGAVGGPVAAKRHEQSGRIRHAIGLGLHLDHGRVQVGLLRIEHGELVDLSLVELLLDDIKARFGGILGAPRGAYRPGVGLL